MAIETTRTTDPETGRISSVTVTWLECTYRRIFKFLLHLIIVPFLFVAFSIHQFPTNPVLSYIGYFFAICSVVYSLPFLKELEQKRSLAINADGSLYAEYGVWGDSDKRKFNTRYWDVAKIEFDQYVNWVKKSEMKDYNQDLMVIILTRTDGAPYFLSGGHYDKAILMRIVTALTNAFAEMRSIVESEKPAEI